MKTTPTNNRARTRYALKPVFHLQKRLDTGTLCPPSPGKDAPPASSSRLRSGSVHTQNAPLIDTKMGNSKALVLLLSAPAGPKQKPKGWGGTKTSQLGVKQPSRWARGCVLDIMHGRSRMTVDPRIPTMPERSTSDFDRTGRHCVYQARSADRRSASRMKGELHLTQNHL